MIIKKWAFKNKSYENGTFVRNKARQVAQGYAKIEGIDFYETFSHVACLDYIRPLLGISCLHEFKLYPMDVKSAFMNGYLNEQVFVEQPCGFSNPIIPDHVF